MVKIKFRCVLTKNKRARKIKIVTEFTRIKISQIRELKKPETVLYDVFQLNNWNIYSLIMFRLLIFVYIEFPFFNIARKFKFWRWITVKFVQSDSQNLYYLKIILWSLYYIKLILFCLVVFELWWVENWKNPSAIIFLTSSLNGRERPDNYWCVTWQFFVWLSFPIIIFYFKLVPLFSTSSASIPSKPWLW